MDGDEMHLPVLEARRPPRRARAATIVRRRRRRPAAVTEARIREPAARHDSVRDLVRSAVAHAWDRAVAKGTLPPWPDDAVPPKVEVERPADPVHGDFSSNLAMKLARPYRMPPPPIPTALAAELGNEGDDSATSSLIESAEVAPPGFLNLRLRPAALETVIARILADPVGWGRLAPAEARSVNVEFVSANPTGPLHVGNARGAFIGDMLGRVLEAGGQRVTREYYFNAPGGPARNPARVLRGARAG